MPDIAIGELSRVGLIRDTIAHRLGPNAWTKADNIRFDQSGAGSITGNLSVLGTPPVAPYFLMTVRGPAQTWFLYTSLTKGYVYNGSTHTDITRTVGGDYTAASPADWNGTILGGIPIINSGTDDPQFWASYNVATKLADLTNWPANTTAKVLRAFGSYLMAFDVTKSGTRYQHMVKWSHPAEVGTVPSSWDETDDTVDAGEQELEDSESGGIQTALQLGNQMFIYKRSSTWRVRFIGGRFIFSFDKYLETLGALSRRAVASVANSAYHLVVGQNDIFIHDGNSAPRSIVDERFRKVFFDSIDKDKADEIYVFDNPTQKEAWICYPEDGQTLCTRALIWNYERGYPGVLSERAITFQAVAEGFLTEDTIAWADAVTTWDGSAFSWETTIGRRVIACDPNDTSFQLLDSGNDFNGVTYSSTLQRTDLGLIGRDHRGNNIVDFKRRKMITRVWIEATGAPFTVRVGGQEVVNGAVIWSSPATFDPTTDLYVDVITQGKALALEFAQSDSTVGPWAVHGYRLELRPLGNF